MSTTRTRWAALLSAGALTLTLGACSGDDADGTVTEPPQAQTQDAATTETAPDVADVAEGEEVDPSAFVAMLKSPGEEVLSSYTMSMTVKAGGQDVTFEGAVDLSGDTPALDVDAEVPGAGAVTMRMVEGRLFMSMPGVTSEGMFMEVPSDQLDDIVGGLEDVDFTSQMDDWETAARKVVFVGDEDVDGTTMRRYQVTLDQDAMMDGAAATEAPEDDAAATSSGVMDVVDLWLDDDNLIRKIASEGPEGVVILTADNWGEPQDIQVPADDEILRGPGGTPDDSSSTDG